MIDIVPQYLDQLHAGINPVKVLIIEDDNFISKMYDKKLNLEHFVVETAGNGVEGLTLAERMQPDVILLDVMLPKMDGWEVLERLKQNPITKDIPVILLTNLGSPEDVQHGLSLGASEYMIKAHYVPTEVVQKIKALVA